MHIQDMSLDYTCIMIVNKSQHARLQGNCELVINITRNIIQSIYIKPSVFASTLKCFLYIWEEANTTFNMFKASVNKAEDQTNKLEDWRQS